MSSGGFDPRSLPPGFTAAPPGGGGGGPRGGGGGGGDGGAGAEAKQDEQRQMMLTVMLTPAARERLNRVALVVRECGGVHGVVQTRRPCRVALMCSGQTTRGYSKGTS